MELQRLREFIVVAECLNFSRAAARLFISQPVLSRHIAELERATGVRLFVRNRQKVQLTPMGELFLQEAKAIVSRYEEACQRLRLASCGMVGHLKIGFLERAVRNFLSDFILHFSRSHPHISVEFCCYRELDELTQALRSDGLDVGLTLALGLNHSRELSQEIIYQDNLCVIVRREHSLSGKGTIALSQLADEPFIMLSRSQNPVVFNHTLQLCEARKFSPVIVKEAPNIDTALLMAELGVGILIAPRHHIIHASPKVCFIDLEDEDCKVDIVAVWKQSNPNPCVLPFIKELDKARDHIKSTLTSHGAITTTRQAPHGGMLAFPRVEDACY
ncbi:LysR family transcriptional regulator [Moorellaceae bacterium AZ2]